jgi:hypothetical protein
MKINMQRHDFLKTGIFGMLESQDQSLIAYTLEHAYEVSPGVFAPKIPPGTYTCIRGIHQLEGMTHTFETFEITGVEGHSNLLFHPGNTNRDSSGCILLGLSRLDNIDILHSKDAFNKFLELQKGVESFALTVS